MPPIPKISKDMIINSSLEIIKAEGIENLNEIEGDVIISFSSVQCNRFVDKIEENILTNSERYPADPLVDRAGIFYLDLCNDLVRSDRRRPFFKYGDH